MAYEFKKLSEVSLQENTTETTNVYIEENGETKRVPADKFGAVKTVNGMTPDENGNITVSSNNDPVIFIPSDGYLYHGSVAATVDEVVDAYMAGKAYVKNYDALFEPVTCFYISANGSICKPKTETTSYSVQGANLAAFQESFSRYM